MKVEFNGQSYNIGNKIGQCACSGCCVNEKSGALKCPANSEGECILPLDKIYVNASCIQVFKL